MLTNMKRLILLCALLITFNSFADELVDAKDAYKLGDCTTAMLSFEKLAEQSDAGAIRVQKEFTTIQLHQPGHAMRDNQA
jgi:hypothetical protein